MQEYTVRVYTSEDNTYPRTEWRQNGQLHRTDGPARECANGDKAWYVNGQLHRLDGPAMTWADGDKAWYVNGQLHRMDGPAIEHANGDKFWYQNDQFHRTDGPAIERADGDKSWWIEGKNYTEEEFRKKTAPTCTTKRLSSMELNINW